MSVAFATVSSAFVFELAFDFDFEVDERRESEVSPTVKVESFSIRREGTRG